MPYALRVTIGPRPARLPAAGLATAIDQPDILIETGADIARLNGPDGTSLLVAGRVPAAAKPADRTAFSDGRFLIVSTDRGRCEIHADRFGRRELYYQVVGASWVFATSMDLLPVAREGVEFDQVALAHALAVYGGRPPKRHTYYKGVRRLGVGQHVYADGANVAIRSEPFTPVSTRAYTAKQLDDYSDTLLDVVRQHGQPKDNIVYLSSGWDSTAILACLVHVFGKGSVRALTGRMRYSERSAVINQFEIDRATAMCQYYGIPLELVEFDYRYDSPAILERWKPLFRAHQLASLVGVNHGLLAEAASRDGGGCAVFAGEVSDGAHNLGFSQFVTVHHPVLDFREYSDKMASYLFGPTFVQYVQKGQFEQDAVYQFLRGRQGATVFDAPAAPADVFKQWLTTFFLRGNRFPLTSLRNCRFLTDGGRVIYEEELQREYLADAAARCTPESLYGWYLHLYNSFHWQGSTVAPLSLTAEARGLTPVLPFWDARIQEFLSAMPESWGRGLDLNSTKYPLKWMLKQRVDYPMYLQTGPHSYIYDVDPGFSHAAEMMYGSGFTPYFRNILKARPYRDVLSREVFDLDYVDGMVTRYIKGEEVRGAELTDLIALASLWMVGFYGAQ